MKVKDNHELLSIAEKAARTLARKYTKRSVSRDQIPGYSWYDYYQDALCDIIDLDVDETKGHHALYSYMIKGADWKALTRIEHWDHLYGFDENKRTKFVNPKIFRIKCETKNGPATISDLIELMEDKPSRVLSTRAKIAEWVINACLPKDEEQREKIKNALSCFDVVFKAGKCGFIRLQKNNDSKTTYKNKYVLYGFLRIVKAFIDRAGGYDNLFGDPQTKDRELQDLYESLLNHDVCRVKWGKSNPRIYLPSSFIGLKRPALGPPQRKPVKCKKGLKRAPRASNRGVNLFERNPNGGIKTVGRNGKRYRVLLGGALESVDIKYKWIDNHRVRIYPDGRSEIV